MHGPAATLIWLLLAAGTPQACGAQEPEAGAPAATDRPPFCGNPDERHVVVNQPTEGLRPVPAGKARIHIFWRGSRVRAWWKTQCKVALNGSWVAALEKNTYSVVDVQPGKLRFCASSNRLRPTWRSLMFLHAAAGERYYVECSPGGDSVGVIEPTLSQVDEPEGSKAIAKHRLVTFAKEER